MSVVPEIFGQLEHINNWCLAFLVALDADIQSNIHTAETQTVASRERNQVLFKWLKYFSQIKNASARGGSSVTRADGVSSDKKHSLHISTLATKSGYL